MSNLATVMHHVPITFNNAPQPHQSSSISPQLSVIPSSFQTESKHGGESTNTNTKNTTSPKRKTENKAINNKKKQCWNCSTSLELYNNPWKIKKVLTKSDIGRLNRLLCADSLESLMLPVLGPDEQRKAKTGMGIAVRVWDVDTMSMHNLVLKRWASFKHFVLIEGWNRHFVKRRGLNTGDEIGFL